MAEANDRFEECLAIVRLALQGKPFTYHGKYLRVPREIRLRPTPRLDRLTFLGAIGQPSSGAKYALLSVGRATRHPRGLGCNGARAGR